jgi:hypothetical protein
MMTKPLAIDLFCGLGGWTEGLLAAGYDVIGFDNERHAYGEHKYPAQLVLQDVLTLHGRQFKSVDLIVASPPCQKYSYMAMPWTRSRRLAEYYRASPERRQELNFLFDCCFRLQREAIRSASDIRRIGAVVIDAADAAHRENHGACRNSGQLLCMAVPEQRADDVVSVLKQIHYLAPRQRCHTDGFGMGREMLEHDAAGSFRDVNGARIGIA